MGQALVTASSSAPHRASGRLSVDVTEPWGASQRSLRVTKRTGRITAACGFGEETVDWSACGVVQAPAEHAEASSDDRVRS